MVRVKVLNNDAVASTTITVALFALNGRKRLLARRMFTVGALSSNLITFELPLSPAVLEFEAQVLVTGAEANTLVSVWTADFAGRVISAQRVVHTELAVLPLPPRDTGEPLIDELFRGLGESGPSPAEPRDG